MSAEKLKLYRVRLGEQYCTLSTKFAELGVCIPDATREGAHEFRTIAAAQNAIARTVSAQEEIAKSLHAEYKGFDPLRFDGAKLSVEEFWKEL